MFKFKFHMFYWVDVKDQDVEDDARSEKTRKKGEKLNKN